MLQHAIKDAARFYITLCIPKLKATSEYYACEMKLTMHCSLDFYIKFQSTLDCIILLVLSLVIA